MKRYQLILPAVLVTLLLLAFAFFDRSGGWQQQFLPNINGRTISDIFFIDSLTGWAVTPYRFQNDTAYIIKTINGGNNWSLQFSRVNQFVGFNRIYFLNKDTGFVCGVTQFSGEKGLQKTIDGGNNWTSLNVPDPFETYSDMTILSNDTIWLVSSGNPTGGVFRTTNGGTNWTQQLNLGSSNPDHIYMINGRVGFIAQNFSYLRKTTNSGQSWNVVSGTDGFLDMHFVDSLTGWKSYGFMKKTTDGGNSWVTQTLQSGGPIITSNMGKFTVLNKDTIWGVGGQIFYGGSQTRGVLWRTTNGGANWAYQAPDTAYGNFNYYFIQFADRLKGWAYTLSSGVHTVTGGDLLFTSVQYNGTQEPSAFKLYQNYPNPFNPVTRIQYELKKAAEVRLRVCDITGREVKELVNSKQFEGGYAVDFNGNNLTSGVYFYSLLIEGKLTDTKKMLLVK